MATLIQYMLLVVFVISFDIFLHLIPSYRYNAIRNNYLNNLSDGVRYSDDPCLESKYFLWKSPMRENISFSSCIKRNETRGGIFAYFVDENFVGATCPKKVIRFSETAMPQVALASFPGSGNTWFRHLIEYVSGIATGSVYCGCVRETFIGECENDTSKTIVIKTHHHFNAERIANITFDKALLILRNPFDALVADFNRRYASKTKIAPIELFQSYIWEEFIWKGINDWRIHATSWITEYRGPIHLVFYENMISNFYEELNKLVTFLGISVNYQEIWCASINQEGLYHRVEKPEWLKTSALFTPEMMTFVRQNIDLVSDIVKTNIKQETLLFEEYYKT